MFPYSYLEIILLYYNLFLSEPSILLGTPGVGNFVLLTSLSVAPTLMPST